MVNRQVRQFYIDNENVDHSITDRLISGGYVQPAGGYYKLQDKNTQFLSNNNAQFLSSDCLVLSI